MCTVWKGMHDGTYGNFTVRHEDGKVCKMAAWAGGVGFVGVQEFAALGGPVAHHTPLRVIPEGAIGVEVVLHLQITRDMVKCPNNWLPKIEAHVEHRGHLPPTHTKYFLHWYGWGFFTSQLLWSNSYVVSHLACACQIYWSMVEHTKP